jgi:hypothetical protein
LRAGQADRGQGGGHHANSLVKQLGVVVGCG